MNFTEEHKHCSKCQEIKPIIDFGKNKTKINADCKKCRNSANLAYKSKNPDKWLEYKRNWNLTNKERRSKRNSELYFAKKEHYRKLRAEYAKTDKGKSILLKATLAWNKRNPDKLKAAQKRSNSLVKGIRKNATPKWLNKAQKEQIVTFYLKAKEISKLTGIIHEVDHIEPIRGKTCCGLHVPWNLQILTKEENIRKFNKLITN